MRALENAGVPYSHIAFECEGAPSGTDVALDAGSVVLMRNKLSDLVVAVRLSKATMRKIKQNLFWALIYNCVMIPLAAVGILAPALAGAAMAFSSVSVVSNSLLLKRFR